MWEGLFEQFVWMDSDAIVWGELPSLFSALPQLPSDCVNGAKAVRQEFKP